MTPKSQRGFTLIELLVVIAIIALLVSILVPSLNKAKELARAAACLSNLHNIAIGAATYAADNDRLLPSAYIDDPKYGWRKTRYCWIGKRGETYGSWDMSGLSADIRHLNPWIGGPFGADDEVPIAHCPSDTIVYDKYGTSYSANNMTYGFYGLERCDYKLNRIKHPDIFIVQGEADAFSTVDPTAMKLSTNWHKGPDYVFQVNYADGHAGKQALIPGRGWDSGLNYTFAYDKP